MPLERPRPTQDLQMYLTEAITWLRPACGCLLIARNRSQHPQAGLWLERLERVLVLVEELRDVIERSQGWEQQG